MYTAFFRKIKVMIHIDNKSNIRIEKSVRSGKVDLLRFAFAVVVALYHLGCTKAYNMPLMQTGYLSVEFFFLVTGYLMAKSLYGKQVVGSAELCDSCIGFIKKKYAGFGYHYWTAVVMICVAWLPYYNYPLKKWLLKIFEGVPAFLHLQTFGFKTPAWLVPMWYLSAMLVSMLILTPILLKIPRLYSLYIAPVIAAFMLGFIYRYYGYFDVFSARWEGYINLGFLRAFAEISIGCFCFYAVESGIFKKTSEKMLSFVAVVLYIGIFLFMTGKYPYALQPLVIICMVFCVAVTFANKNTFKFLNNKFVYFLGRLSLPIYLCHHIARAYVFKISALSGHPMRQLAVYLVMTAVVSVACLFIGDAVKKFARHTKKE